MTAGTVRGPSHVSADKPNQDAFDYRVDDQAGYVCVAISDGHGGSRYVRSDRGSRLAVNVALEVLDDLLKKTTTTEAVAALRNASADKLPRELIRKWREAVLTDLRDDPLQPDHDEPVPAADVDADQAVIELYGATLLACGISDHVLLYAQIGDGDILEIDSQGSASRPIPRSPMLIANETTSLCMPNAWRDLDVVVVPTGKSPAAILLASDGYSNSFENEQAFLRTGPDILQIARSGGIDSVASNLESWIVASAEQSGDDVTLGLIFQLASVDFEAPTVRLRRDN